MLMRMRQPCRASTPSVGRRHGCRRAPALASATHGLRHSVLSATAAASVALDAVAPGWSVLISPDVQLPRDAATALRRSVPAVVAGSGNAQSALEDVQHQLRIPQKKPWKDMQKEVDEAKSIIEADKVSGRAFDTVHPSQRDTAQARVDTLDEQLTSLSNVIQKQDAEQTASTVNKVLAMLSDLETLQAPTLPYSLPSSLRSKPHLEGRATVELTYERPNGYFALKDGIRPKEVTLTCILDGYSAPLTAGNFALLARDGWFDGNHVQSSDEAIFNVADTSKPKPEGATNELPLEFKPLGSFEPTYRVPLDTLTGVGTELPSLPLSVYGSIAMTRSAEQEDLSDPSECAHPGRGQWMWLIVLKEVFVCCWRSFFLSVFAVIQRVERFGI